MELILNWCQIIFAVFLKHMLDFSFYFFLSFHKDTLQSRSTQVANKMYQMHGEKPSHSILSGYLNDRYKLTFDHFGWEDQY